MILAAITETDIAAWTAIALTGLTALGTIATAVVAIVAKVSAAANAARLDRHGSVLNSVQLATPPAPPPAAPAPKIVIDYPALAAAIVARQDAAKDKQP